MKQILLFLSFLIFLPAIVFAQESQNIITGKVRNSNSGEPLVGATVIEKGTTNGTIVDVDGNFKLSVPPDATIIVSFIGYQVKEVPVGNMSKFSISLDEDVKALDEIVVIGYGTQRKSDLTGSVASVKGEELKKSTGSSFGSAIQGRIAGVQVTTNDGEPGAGLIINIRGASSLNGSSEPLYVIDGMPILKDDIVGATDGTIVNLPSDPLSGINPSDIESIEVLKDASATAIYGSRGANGVVLITTKQGKAGDLKISYDGSYGISMVSNKLDLFNAREYYEYQYLRDPNQVIFTDNTARNYVNPEEIPSVTGGIDWQDAVYQDAPMQNHRVDFSGGSENSQYYASLGYYSQDGIVVSSNFKRYTGLINLNSKAGKFSFSGNMNFSYNEKRGSVYASGGPNNDFAGTITKLYFARPLGSVNDIDPEVLSDDDEDVFNNPYLFATTVTNDDDQTRITGNVKAAYEVFDNFELSVRVGGNIVSNKRMTYFPKETTAQGKKYNGRASVVETWSNRYLIENLATYKLKKKGSNLDLMAGFSLEKGIRQVSNFATQNFAYDNTGVHNIGLGTDLQVPRTNYVDNTLVSFLSRANYHYKRKYFATFNVRIDGSSKFPVGNKYAVFPSGALSWRISEEDFIKKSELISQLKLRYSYGATGNQAIPSYQSIPLLQNVTYSYGGGLQTGLVFGQLANRDLRWETTYQQNIGLDIGLLDDRFNITIDAYQKKSKDLLLRIPVSAVVGVGNPIQNIGEIENKGLELSINTVNIDKGDFSWKTNFNLSANRNKIKSLGELESFYASFGPKGSFQDLNIYQTNGVIGEFYGYKSDGIITSQEMLDSIPKYNNAQVGGWKIVDVNGDSTINSEDRVVIGNNQPDYFGGLTNILSWKGFDLSVFFQFSVGQEIYNANRVILQDPNDNLNKQDDILYNSFRPAVYDDNNNLVDRGNLDGMLPQIGSNVFDAPINAFVEDGSYIRLQNITLGYALPQSLNERMGISRCRIYVSANNLFTWTDYSGYDPDVSTNGNNSLIKGVDWGAYPRSKSIMAGLNISF